jgi:hypothetical protein
MQTEKYRGYMLWGHVIRQQEDILQAERYAAGGTVTRDNRFVEASGVLGIFDTNEEAKVAGLGWARAWVDTHG